MLEFFGVILYDPPPEFAVKTALWLLKPGTRDPRLDLFQGFSILYCWIPGQFTKTSKEQLFSTI